MDIQPQQPISDDQELAKVLAGITAGADGTATTDLADELEQEATTKTKGKKQEAETPTPDVAVQEPVMPVPDPAAVPTTPVMDSGLASIKNDALNELRPLVDKLNVSPEEKFDTYLLLIRSTDDATLIAPAFEAARNITDEAGKAQALLDIVKEIDYLSNPQKQAA